MFLPLIAAGCPGLNVFLPDISAAGVVGAGLGTHEQLTPLLSVA